MSLSLSMVSALACDGSRRGPRGVLNELRTRTGLEAPDPLAHLTLQERRLAFIRRERPVAYAILRRTWPMGQARNPGPGNSPVRARLLDSVSRMLQRDGGIPSSEDLIDFEALGMIDTWLDFNIDEAIVDILALVDEAADEECELDHEAALGHVEAAFELSVGSARDHAQGLDDEGNSLDDPQHEAQWYEQHICNQQVEVEWDNGQRFVSTNLRVERHGETVPKAIHGSSSWVEDPRKTLPPWAEDWIGSRDFTDEELFNDAS